MRQIDSKYAAVGAHQNSDVDIINSRTGEILREDEPLFLFRARDWLVRSMLYHYRELCVANKCAPEHIAGVDELISKAERFAADHPERIKLPD